MKKALWILAACSGIVLAAFMGLRILARQFWESTLDGPFTGTVYSGIVTTAPVSVLNFPSRGQLEVHELPAYTNPVVLLRSPRGDIRWSRLFIPAKKQHDGSVHRAALRELRLQSWERRSTGSVVFVTCRWDWGGKEAGLIDLDTNDGFRSFKLSW